MKRADKADMGGMSKLISAGLRKQAAAAHLEADVLAAFSENALPSAERDRVVSHLADCGDCREMLFLSQPQAAEDQRIFPPAPSRAAFVVRWVGLAAAVVIVGSGIFISRHELMRRTETTAKQTQGAEPLANLAEEKSSVQPTRERGVAVVPSRSKQEVEREARPALKHMTAKPQAGMRFDANGEVHVSNSPVFTQSGNFQTGGRDHGELGGLVATARPAQPAAAPPPALTADKAKSEETPRSVTESVQVALNGMTANEMVEVDVESHARKDSVAALQSGHAAAGYVGNVPFMKLQPPAAQWSLTSAGAVQRSFDQGKTWQQVPVNSSAQKFLAVFSSGTHVWVGGMAGALYQSTDSGITWTPVTPATRNGRQLTSDIVHVEFTDAQNGKVTGSNGEVWATTDGGQSWQVTKK